jgi:hypothetical protein
MPIDLQLILLFLFEVDHKQTDEFTPLIHDLFVESGKVVFEFGRVVLLPIIDGDNNVAFVYGFELRPVRVEVLGEEPKPCVPYPASGLYDILHCLFELLAFVLF